MSVTSWTPWRCTVQEPLEVSEAPWRGGREVARVHDQQRTLEKLEKYKRASV